MKNIIIFLFVFAYSLSAQFNGPKIVAQESEYNFGEVDEGIIVSHKFIIYNRGGEKLEIQKVKASCGCTAAQPVKTVLSPFDSTSIEVQFNTKNRIGKQKKYVYVFSNDPENPQLRLSFTADIVKKEVKTSELNNSILKLSEYNHNFCDVKKGDILNFNIEYKNEGTDDLVILNSKSSCECITIVANPQQLKPKETGTLNLNFDTKKLIGKISRTVTIQSNDSSDPQKVITLIANIQQG